MVRRNGGANSVQIAHQTDGSTRRRPGTFPALIKRRSRVMALESMQDLLIHQLQDIYSAEQMVLKALPKMREKASTEELATAFASHLTETENQVDRLERVFELLGERAGGVKCKAMEG